MLLIIMLHCGREIFIFLSNVKCFFENVILRLTVFVDKFSKYKCYMCPTYKNVTNDY